MANPPQLSDILDAAFTTQPWVLSDKSNYDQNGVALGALPESTAASKVTAEMLNGMCASLRQVSDMFRGVSEATALDVASALGIPDYTTAARPANAKAGRVIWDTDLGALLVDTGSAWVQVGGPNEIVNVDFSAEPIQDFAAGGDGVYLIAGVNWTVASSANADILRTDGANGLRFNADTTSTAYDNSTATAARIFTSLTALYPNWDPFGEYIVDFYFSNIAMAVNNNRVFVGLSRPTASGNVAGGGRYRISSEDRIYAQSQATILSSDDDSSLDTIGLKIGPHGLISMAAAWSGDWPAFYTNTGASVPQLTSAGGFLSDRGASLVIAFPTGETGGDMEVTLERFRIRRVR